MSVAPIIAKAKPDEMPRNSAASGAGSKYGRMPSGRRACQLAEVVVIVDRQGRMIGEAARLVDRLLHGLGRDARAWRSGNRCASRRSSSRPAPGSTTRCTGPAWGSGAGRRRHSRARRTPARATRAPPAGSRSSSGCDFQFLRSISLWAMFQSPHRMNSWPRSCSLRRWTRNCFRKRNLEAWRCGPAEPDGRYTEITHSLPKRAST